MKTNENNHKSPVLSLILKFYHEYQKKKLPSTFSDNNNNNIFNDINKNYKLIRNMEKLVDLTQTILMIILVGLFLVLISLLISYNTFNYDESNHEKDDDEEYDRDYI